MEGRSELPRTELDTTIGPVIKAWFSEYIHMPEEERRVIGFESFDVDISNPNIPDMDALSQDNYEVRYVRTSPATETEGAGYHFYAGKPGESRTEVHLRGKAAEQVSQRVSQTNPTQ